MTTRPPRPVPPHAPWADAWQTIGVTGTNGKTTTTHFVGAALRASGRSVYTLTTVDRTLDGAPLEFPRSLQGLFDSLAHAHDRGCRHAALEVTSRALALGHAKRWRFDIGVFTNLSPEHLHTHGSWEHYLASKAQLFIHLGPGQTAVLNARDPASLLLDQAIPGDVTRRWFSVPSRGEAVHAADLEARAVEVSREGTTITLAPSPLAEALGGALELQMIGEIFAENALAAAAATLAAGVPGEAVARGLASCPRSRGRFELLARRPTVAVDYAHTPDALARTCDTARRLAGDRAVIMVFGAGGDTDPGKRAPMGEAAGSRADLVILTTDNARGEDPAAIAAALEVGCRRGGRARVVIELDRARAIERALAEAGEDDVIVIAGKGHEEGQTIAGVTAAFSDHEVVATLLGAAPRERST